jgi:hypothetical protein
MITFAGESISGLGCFLSNKLNENDQAMVQQKTDVISDQVNSLVKVCTE